MSDGSDNFDFSDGEMNDRKHEKLVEDVLNLNKIQNVKKPSRTEPTAQISEFNLVKSVLGNKGTVYLNELTKVLKLHQRNTGISKKVRLTKNIGKTLPTSLEKPQAELIRRSLNFEKFRLQLDKWEALVTSNRAASNISFPLDSIEKLKIEEKKAEVYPSTWRIKSDLQKELEKTESKVEEYHIDTEPTDTFPLTLKELKGKRKEAAKLRAHQSYKEAKARQQNKIKSKKYHRILRREKIKQKLKEFEELQKTNPEAAMKKLEDIEKARAEERFSLRHKGTGQWARNKQVRAKYDKESRQVLAQQLAISRELTQKLQTENSDSGDEETVSPENSVPNRSDVNNPWVHGIKPNDDVVDFVSGYRKYWNELNKQKENSNNNISDNRNQENEVASDKIVEESYQKKQVTPNFKERSVKKNKQKKMKLQDKKNTEFLDSSVSTCEWEVSILNSKENSDVEDVFEQLEEKLEQKLKQKYNQIKTDSVKSKKKIKRKQIKNKTKIDLTMPSKSKKIVINEEMIEDTGGINQNGKTFEEHNANLNDLKSLLTSEQISQEVPNINPNKFIGVKKTNLNTAIPDVLTTDENEEIVDQSDVILEAFEDDDIAEDFEKEKRAEVDKDTPKDIDLNLPGWGSWGGANINPKKRKRKRFIIKMPPKMPRKDDNKGSLIINEKADAKMKPLMVSVVPFPFKSVKDYEASMRAPIGNTFVPETAFKKLIEPAVTTKIGTIIEPISKRHLMGRKHY